MKNKSFTRLPIIIFSVIVLFGCSFTPSATPTGGSGCFPPEASFAFPVGQPASKSYKTPDLPIPGEVFVILPDHFYQGSELVYYKDSLWTLGGVLNGTFITYEAVLRYNLESREWKEYTTVDGKEFLAASIGGLLVSPDGILWSIQAIPDKDEPSFLKRYNDAADKFEYVPYQGEYFQEQMERIGEEILRYQFTGYSFGPDGHLWLTDRYNLYEFDPTNSKIEPRARAEAGSAFAGPSVGPDGTVWFLDFERGRLMKYTPATQQLEGFLGKSADGYSRDDFEIGTGTFLDSRGRLWVSDAGWIDTRAQDSLGDPLWYRVIRSPVFIYQLPSAENKYEWGRPTILLETSDGSLWFGTSYLLVRLDTKSETWCKVSKRGFVAEDDQGNIWILYLNQIYKYQGKP